MSLILKNVTKNYIEPDGTVLNILNVPEFNLNKGEQVVLVGSSGGGKTTLLNVISGITKADSGEVIIDGTEISRLPEAARDRFRAERIGFIFQTFNLLPAFTAIENVMLGMSFTGKKANRDFAIQLLEKIGLSHRVNHRPAQMSVGEQQRVAIARSLANQPSLLLADEPTASVDSANQDNILELIQSACSEFQISLLLVTHSPEIAAQFERVEQLSNFNRTEVTS